MGRVASILGTTEFLLAGSLFSKAPQTVANFPREQRSKIKAWSSGLGVGHYADSFIMERMITLRSTKSEAMAKLIQLEYQRRRRRGQEEEEKKREKRKVMK